MVQADPKDAIIRKQIERIHFGFYTDADVRARSVCEVTSSVTVDALNTPLPNGLYDPRLGSTATDSGPCPTCACGYQTCPGHFGHIELCVPVYHPLLFEKILAMLRVKCWSCHRLKAPPRVLQLFQAKFQLLQLGKYTQALELDDLLAASTTNRRMQMENSNDSGTTKNFQSIEEAGKRLDAALEEVTNTYITNGPATHHERSSFEQAYHRELVSQLNTHCKTSKSCPHCGAQSPRIRQDSSNKFFQAPLSATAKRHNAAEGVKIRPALTKKGEDDKDKDDNDNGYDSDDTKDKDSDEEDEDDEDDEEEKKKKKKASGETRDKYMHPAEVQAQIQRMWETNPDICNAMFANQGHAIFFMQTIPVPPSRFRPPMALGGMMVEHVQNAYLSKMITSNELSRTAFASGNEAQGYKDWIELQTFVNCFMDSSKDPGIQNDQQPGIRQLLERKEGIFRKHMMGKRVNFACRSVISPDPYVGTNEIGLPRFFAETLTYPTPVTDINIQEMRNLVERGPNQYPGARWIEFPHRRVDLSKMDAHKREAAAAQLLAWAKKGGKPAIVGRQLRDGDMVLMNRQPTLHKPGIMAHQVRVLHNPTQKTIRMHYANCNTYNADFDGDEMNCHFPQSDLARAEAEYLAKTDLQFIVPTDGSPLRGLIQDHVVAGVKLTKRDTFIEKWEYQQLLYAALASLPRLELIRSDADIELMPPAILKPKELWTGKQVISTLLNHLRKGNDRDGYNAEPFPGISTERKAKTPAAAFGEKNEEHLVLIRDGELLRGILDKSAFGATDYSLVHAVYQAYGPEKAGLLLNSLGRLFTAYLQFYAGHSCRMEDLILTKEADQRRRNLINKAYNVGARAAKAWADSEGGKVPIDLDESRADRPLKPVEAASSASKVRNLLSGNEGKENFAHLDGFMMSKLNPLASEIVKACLPDGLAVKFPANTFGIMCSTGAKGSIVNQSQVSCALGQQALEGRRVPRLASGRTLPSFAPYDVNPRADGFVMDRFLTGIRPQEYYFHCMAGREGLVDTAVKTSRSGYLQRCLVKHLEELKVCYDNTVRNGEGGVVQFLYGEDGIDPTKASYLDGSSDSFEFIARNHKSLGRRHKSLPGSTIDIAASDLKRVEAVSKNSKDLFQMGSFVKARKLRVGSRWERGALCRGWYDAVVVKNRKGNPLTLDIKYLKDDKVSTKVPVETDFGPGKSLCSICTIIKPAAADPILSLGTKSHRFGTSGACVSERFAGAAASALEKNNKLAKALKSNSLSAPEFGGLVAAMYGAAMCAPGEAVGSIAAQSVGEPSTQMTLNTFHLAGAGANVTLGIPRLREIIMTASRQLKTPTMSVPLHNSVTEKEAKRLTRSFAKLTLNELIAGHQGIVVRETLAQNADGLFERAYYVTLKFHPAERIKEAFGLNLSEIAKVVSKNFVPALANQMKLELRRSAAEGDMVTLAVEGGESQEYVTSKDAGDETPKRKNRKKDDADAIGDEADDDDDESDDEVGDEDGVAATRGQAESYGGRDEDENSTASRESSDPEDGEDGTQGDKVAESGFDINATLEVFEDDALKIDKKANAIHLRPLRVDPMARPLLMVGLVETAATKTLVRSRKNIDQAFVNKEEGGRGRCLQTAGVNFEELWQLDMVDHNRLLSNDIWAIRCAYGVEAARNNIVEQIRAVFGAYGIEVDPRHLSLIADYMTYNGEYSAMNRICMRDSSSPFLQMSFETTAQFMTHAALTGASDALLSPSANIVVGQPVRHGTGAFSLLSK